MGYLSHENHEIEFDDRTLAHLHVVIVHKLRSGQSFAMSWRDAVEDGGGRTSIWLHPASNLRFHFDRSGSLPLNRQWLSELAASADGRHGLVVSAEKVPEEDALRLLTA